ncbi:O-antigen ligase family protein [Amnibacterium endophyticum]|uniref:O-antigen ligase family protein n=1 Tax=Amnibacterium endophyticum TaxID=2109337 RepID=A0ABW4LDW7_9MICO
MRVPRSPALWAPLALLLGGFMSAAALIGAPLLGRSAPVDGVIVIVIVAALWLAAAFAVPTRALPTMAILVYALIPYRVLPGAVLLLIWSVRRAAAARRVGPWPSRGGVAVLAIVSALLLVAVLSLVVSPYRGASAAWTVNCLLALGAVVVVGDCRSEAASLRRVWPAVGAVVGAYAVLEYVLRRNPVYGAVDQLIGGAAVQNWSGYRSTASLDHPVYLGMFLACSCALAVGAFARGSRWSLVAVVLTGGGLVTTLSRGAFLALGVAGVVGAILAAFAGRAVLRRFAAVLVVAAAITAVALPVLLERFGSSEAQGSVTQRTRTYDIVFSAWTQHPVLGTGGGTAADAVGDAILSLRYIENWYLQILLGLGAVGLLVVAALVAALLTTAVRRRDLPAAMLTAAFCVAIATYNADDRAATLFLLALVVVVVVGGGGAAVAPGRLATGRETPATPMRVPDANRSGGGDELLVLPRMLLWRRFVLLPRRRPLEPHLS